MCLLFLYINPTPKEGEYKLVLVNNRDETYSRPAKPAHFWDSKILAGMDAEKGREGGTWLGVTESGKIGCLLNIFVPKDSFNKDGAGRGFLVVDYLLGKETGPEYATNISKSGVIYNPFNLITLEPNERSFDLTYYNSCQNSWQKLDSKYHGFGNCPVEKPFNKVLLGRDKLEKIIETFGKEHTEEQLIAELNLMMRNCDQNYPDEQLSEQGKGHPVEFVKRLSSICVTCPSVNYGTRTTTVILVDYSDRIVYREETMKEPIDLENINWEVNHFDFMRKFNS